MTGRRAGQAMKVGMVAVLAWVALGPVTPAAEPERADPPPERTARQPQVSDYVRVAEAARARALAAGGRSAVVYNDDLPDLRYVDRQRMGAESPAQPLAGDDPRNTSGPTPAGQSGEIRPAVRSPEVAPAKKPTREAEPVEMTSERRAEISRWKQRMAEAESNLRSAEQRVAELERNASGQGAQFDARSREARRKLAEANSLIQRLRRRDPGG